MTQPGIKTISRAVAQGLGIAGNLTPALVPNVTFGPTLGLAAGRIDKLGMDLDSFRVPLVRAITEVIIPSIKLNFDEGGRPAWEPLSDFAVKMRGSARPILVRTGALEAAATSPDIWDITAKSAVIRDLPESVWYGKVQQGGHEAGSMAALIRKHAGDVVAANTEHTANLLKALAGDTSGISSDHAATIPARPFLMYQPEDEVAIRQIFVEWLGEKVEENWS